MAHWPEQENSYMAKNPFKEWDKFMKIYEEKQDINIAFASYRGKRVYAHQATKLAKDREKRYREHCAREGLYIPPGRPVKIPEDFE